MGSESELHAKMNGAQKTAQHDHRRPRIMPLALAPTSGLRSLEHMVEFIVSYKPPIESIGVLACSLDQLSYAAWL